jgi:hypothetical protein
MFIQFKKINLCNLLISIVSEVLLFESMISSLGNFKLKGCVYKHKKNEKKN